VEELALRVGQAGRKFILLLVFVFPKVHEVLGELVPCFFRDGVGVGSLLAILLRVGNQWLAAIIRIVVVSWVVVALVIAAVVVVAMSSSTTASTTPSSTSPPATASTAFSSSSTTAAAAVDLVPRAAASTAVVVAHDGRCEQSRPTVTYFKNRFPLCLLAIR